MHDAHLDGLVLAAFTVNDPTGSIIAPQLREADAQKLGKRLRKIGELEPATRRAEIRRCADRLRTVAVRNELPAPVRGLLAPDMPRDIAARWSADAPPVRTGYRCPPGLLTTLRRLAQDRWPE